MNWESVRSVSFVILGLLVLLIPFYALIRWPGALTLGAALGLIGASIIAVFPLTVAFQGLAALFPGLNPYRPPAYGSIDGGLFGLFVGLTLALLLLCVGQGLWIRSRL